MVRRLCKLFHRCREFMLATFLQIRPRIEQNSISSNKDDTVVELSWNSLSATALIGVSPQKTGSV
jgi:hypothetical protein